MKPLSRPILNRLRLGCSPDRAIETAEYLVRHQTHFDKYLTKEQELAEVFLAVVRDREITSEQLDALLKSLNT